MSLELADLFRALAVSHLLFLLALLIRDERAERSKRVIGVFILGVISYVVLPVLLRNAVPAWLLHPFFALSAAIPFLFWLLARTHFSEDTRVSAATWASAVLLVLFNYLPFAIHAGGPASLAMLRYAPSGLWHLVPKLVGGAFVFHAFWMVYNGGKSDLVALRIKLRYLFLFVLGGYILVVIVGEMFFLHPPAPPRIEVANAALIYGLVLAASFLFTKAGADFLREIESRTPPVDPELRRRFERLMDEERVYRKEGLTIRRLAAELGDYEYKVRQLINTELGFKNFNAFLHHFRIRDARVILKDPAQDHRTIADIAFELGYQSLGPFNKAFREALGATPSEYRKSRSS